MKLNVKVTSKDLTIFIIFSVILFYVCSITVLNIMSMVNEGEFAGLNPFPALLPPYVLFTVIIFVCVEIGIILSVKDTIFDFGDGIGLTIGEKESKGYSRWFTEKEMKKAYKVYKVGVKDKDADQAGVVFINDGKDMWVDDSENHTLVIGTTGSGKTSAVVNPLIYSLIKHRESMVITDPKGEIYSGFANLLKDRGYKIVVLNFRNPNLGNAWNPLTLPYRLYKEGNVDKASELIDDVASNIIKDKKSQDPFWENSSADYFAGCALGLMEDGTEEECNINSINYMTTVGEEKIGSKTFIQEYFTMKGENSNAYVFASNTINSPNETKGGILAVFRSKIRLFASREQLSEMLSHSDFDMEMIGKEPTAVFIVIHDEKTTYHALATIFVKQCYETLISVAQANGGPLPVRTNFILDEFANMPALKDVTTMVTAARSRQIRFTFIIQNFSQLNEVYGKEDAETIRSNCQNLIYILTTELSALEEISKLCGEVKSKKDDKTESHPLITVSDLQKLKMNEVIILRNRLHPFKTVLKQGFNTDWGDSEFDKHAEFVEREKTEIKYFDLKNFVTVRKRSKGEDITQQKSPFGGMGGNPFGGGASPFGGGANPFGGGGGAKIPSFEEFMAQRNKEKAERAKMEPVKPDMGKPNFDIDDLVKRIDAKIAELEEEQRREEEEQARKLGGSAAPSGAPAIPVNPLDVSLDTKEPSQPFVEKKPFIDPIMDEEISEVPVNNTGIKTFEDIIREANAPAMETKKEEPKPSVMISTPIDEVPNTRVSDVDDNVSNKPTSPTSVPDTTPPKEVDKTKLSGIVDPTNMTFESFMNSNGANIPTNNTIPSNINVNQASTVSTMEVPDAPVTPDVPTQVVNNDTVVTPIIHQPQQQVVINTTVKKPIQTQVQVDTGVNNIKVDTQSQVVPQQPEDEDFFDDFFEE